MIYHVAKQSGFSYPDSNFFRKATDFGAALYCSFDEDSALQFYDYLEDQGEEPVLLVSDVPIAENDENYPGFSLYNFGVGKNVSDEDAIRWVQQVMLARVVAFMEDDEEIPEWYNIDLHDAFYDKDTYKSLLTHPDYNIIIGNRADSDVLNILKGIMEEDPVYGLFDDDSCLEYYDRLNPLHFTPQVSFDEDACRLFSTYPWRMVQL